MSTPLDGLREAIIMSVVMTNQRVTSRTIDKAFDLFEAEHPGLVDKTTRCDCCGAPWSGHYYQDGSASSSAMRLGGWRWVETCDRITPIWDIDDNELWRLCSACAKEAEHE